MNLLFDHEVKADREYIPKLRYTIHNICQGLRCSERDMGLVVTAIWEGIANAISHGSPNPESDTVRVRIAEEDNTLQVDIKSRKAGFVLPEDKSLPDPTSNRGRGLPIIYAVMDNVAITQQEDGVTLHMKKKLPSPAGKE